MMILGVACEVDGRIFDPRLRSFPGLAQNATWRQLISVPPSHQVDSNREPERARIRDDCRSALASGPSS